MSAATTLSFLTDEGAITVSFRPQLTAEQYEALFDLVQEGDILTDELCEQLKALAEEWGVRFSSDDCNARA
jgi:hypothetical protein